MDISHITNLLSSLGKNQVTIPIVSNEFIETNVDSFYTSVLKNDIFEDCDDLMKGMQNNKTRIKVKQVISNDINKTRVDLKNNVNLSQSECNNKEEHYDKKDNLHVTYENILHLLACIQDNLLVFEKNTTKHINIYVKDLLNFVSNNPELKSVNIGDKKFTKTAILQELMKLLNIDDASKYKSIDVDTIKLLLTISSKYLNKHIILYNGKAEIVYCEFDYTNHNIEEIVLITKSDTDNYNLNEVMKVSVFKDMYVKENINEIKQQDNYKENLKSLCVKDLRQIAQKLCIDIIDTHTSKLYSKVELRLLIEAKLNSI